VKALACAVLRNNIAITDRAISQKDRLRRFEAAECFFPTIEFYLLYLNPFLCKIHRRDWSEKETDILKAVSKHV
jgi:hypothetical protein